MSTQKYIPRMSPGQVAADYHDLASIPVVEFDGYWGRVVDITPEQTLWIAVKVKKVETVCRVACYCRMAAEFTPPRLRELLFGQYVHVFSCGQPDAFGRIPVMLAVPPISPLGEGKYVPLSNYLRTHVPEPSSGVADTDLPVRILRPYTI